MSLSLIIITNINYVLGLNIIIFILQVAVVVELLMCSLNQGKKKDKAQGFLFGGTKINFRYFSQNLSFH